MAAIKRILGEYILLDTTHFSSNNGVFDSSTDNVQKALESIHDKISVLSPENTLKLNILEEIIQEEVKNNIISSSQISVKYDFVTKKMSFELVDGFLDGLINIDLNTLSNVEINNATNGQILVYSESIWKNRELLESDISDLNKYSRQEINSFLEGKANKVHFHDESYYSKSEIDSRSWWKNVNVNSNYNANNKDYLFIDTSFDILTVTLPLNPKSNTRVYILDNTGSFGINTLIIDRNGKTIMGIEENLLVDVKNIGFEILYNGTDWRIIR